MVALTHVEEVKRGKLEEKILLYVKDCRERVYRLRPMIADHLIGGQISAAKDADILSTSFEGYTTPSSKFKLLGTIRPSQPQKRWTCLVTVGCWTSEVRLARKKTHRSTSAIYAISGSPMIVIANKSTQKSQQLRSYGRFLIQREEVTVAKCDPFPEIRCIYKGWKGERT